MAKRKNRDPNVIRIGNKTISLEGYLTKRVKTADSSKDNEHSVTGTTEQKATVDDHVRIPDQVGKCNTAGGEKISGDVAYLDARQKLPIWSYREQIRSALRQHDVLVLVGETGSGKSTQVPQFLFEEAWCQRRKVRIQSSGGRERIKVGGVIAVTQPRRIAATTLAHRVSKEAGTPLTKTKTGGGASSEKGKGKRQGKGLVGYSVRFDHMVPRGTKIKFLTEGMLLQELLQDPFLRQYSAVIVDEVHERSMDVDLLCGFLKQLVSGDKSGRAGVPLKVVTMSATANVHVIRNFFSTADSPTVPFLAIEGRQYPVQCIYLPQPVPNVMEAVLKVVFKIHTQEALPGDVLVFFTGQEEIEKAQRLIEEHAATLPSNVPKVQVLPLFGQLSIEAQNEVFKPTKQAMTRKIVLATNIAETSVTVPGVRYVVDRGGVKVKEYKCLLGMESLLAKPISKSSAVQRAGRAGREGPGKCFRLYTKERFELLKDEKVPEILRSDVLSAVLTMKARGIDDVLGFPLMDTPDVKLVKQALTQLNFLGAISYEGAISWEGAITDSGRKMALLPLPAPFAKVLLASSEASFDCVLEVIDIISCVTSGEDIFLTLRCEEEREAAEEHRQALYRREGDLITYLTTMQQYAAQSPADRLEWCKLRKLNIRNMKQAWNIRRQLRHRCQKESLIDSVPSEWEDSDAFSPISPDQATKILKCFLTGFAHKTAMLASDKSYQIMGTKQVVAIHPSSVLHGKKRDAIMFLDHVYTTNNYAKKVSAIQTTWVLELVEG